MAWARERGVDVGIVRIFNTYGPRLREGDGQVFRTSLCRPSRAARSPSTETVGRRAACATRVTSLPGSWRCSGRHRAGQPRQPGRANGARAGKSGARRDGLVVRGGPPRGTEGRPDAAKARHHASARPARLGTRGDSGRRFAEHDQLVRRPSRPRDPAEVGPIGLSGSPQDDDMTEPVSLGGPTTGPKPDGPMLLAEDGSWSCRWPRHQPTCTADVLIRSPSVGRFEWAC